MIQVCSGCGTRWNVRDKQRMWCPRCQAALLAPSPEQAGSDPRWGGSPAARQLRGRTRSCRAATDGSPCAPGPGRRSGAGRRVLSPTPRYPANPGWGLNDYTRPDNPGAADHSGRAVGRACQVGPEGHRDRVGRRRCRARGALRPAGDQPQHAAASRGRRCGALARRRRQRGGIDRGGRLRDRAHQVADRPSRGRLRALPARRSATAGCAVGRLPDSVGQPRVGTGPRRRDRDRRRGLQPTAQADHRVVGVVGAQHRCCRSSRSRPVSPPTRRASPTTP